MSYVFGWDEAAAPAGIAAVTAALAAQGFPVGFSDQAPNLMRSTAPTQPFILHDAAKKVPGLGNFLRSQNQPRGTCVSRGAKRIVDLNQCIAIAAGEPLEFKYVSHAYIYGTCRQHGGGLGPGDGAVGAWAAWSVANDGNLTAEELGHDDNSDTLAVEWGWRGVPEAVRTKGRLHLVKRVAQARTFEEVVSALASGNGVTVASNVGYTGNGGFRRDNDGVCRAGGSWSHQMCFTGYHPNLNGRGEALLQDQSWGANNPSGPLGPIPIPDYSFWTLRADAERQIRQNDTWVFSGINGWVMNIIPWIFGA